MIRSLREAMRAGFSWIANTPQVWSTAFLAVAIVGSYLLMAERFAAIALDAQERLVNVRIGALQDAFVPLAELLAEDPPALTERMRALKAQNPTIVEMTVVGRQGERWVTIASTQPQAVGSVLIAEDFLFGLAQQDKLHSITIEESPGRDRFYATARFIADTPEGPLIAFARQTLSEADAQVNRSILEGFGMLVLVLMLLLILFFRHSRIIDYAALYERLKEVDSLKDDFLSMASHELRTPLTIIRGYADELHKPLKVALRKEIAGKIDGAARDLDALIADMLDVSRIEQGRMRYDLVRLAPDTAIRETCEELRTRAEAKGLGFTLELAEGLVLVADGSRLRQITLNLIGNAIKYTPKGSIAVRLFADQDQVVLEVQDTGVGMSAEEQAKLFGKFYRASGEAVRAQPGTGLGLWITKQMIEAMHGSITVESIKDVGSRFRVSFPKA